MFKVTTGNSKLGRGVISAINLPALKTCRADAPCRKLCYANKGTFKYSHVKNCYEGNLKAFLDDPQQAELDILNQLPLMGFCRVHASGDILNREYFDMLVRISKKAKGVKFMCFTKKYELVNEYINEGNKLPSNLKVIFSGWNGLEMPNPNNLPTAYVELKKSTDDRIKKTAIKCSGACSKCFACWSLKKGQQVLFHQH